MRKTSYVLALFLLKGLFATAQPTFPCNGDFLFTRQFTTPPPASTPNTYVSKVNFVTGDVNISNPITISPAVSTNASVQYNGYVWTKDWLAAPNFTLLRIAADGTSTPYVISGIPNSTFNNAGVDRNGNMYILSATNPVNLYTISLSSGNPTTATVTAVSFPGLAVGNSIIWGDIAIDPLTNRVYAWYHPTDPVAPLVGLYEITNISTTPALTKIGSSAQPFTMGSLFFNDRGQMFSYGSSTLGGTQNLIFAINKATGAVSQYGVPDLGVSQSDGCECVFRVTLDLDASKPVINLPLCGADEFYYTVTPRNYTATVASNITFTNTLDSRLSYNLNAAALQTQLQAIYGGAVAVSLTSQGGGTNNVLTITGMNIAAGQNSFNLPVTVNANNFSLSATISQEASLSGIPTILGGPTELSNNPGTFNPKDATTVVINLAGTKCLPPVADNFINQPMPQSNGATAIPVITAADPDGTITSYTIATIPPAGEGVLLLSGTPITAGQVLTPAQISSLQFDPAGTFTGTSQFTFTATDNSGNVSNTATYKIPVIALPPVSNNIMEVSMPNTNGATPVKPLSSADPDGTIASYTISTIPPAGEGVLLLSGVPVTAGQVLTPAQISQLQFDPAPAFIGNSSFNYSATDNSGNVSNTANYTIPVTATVTSLRPPLANNITAQVINNSASAVAIPSLLASDYDGTVASYTITTIPPAGHGVLLLSGTPVTAGQVLTPAQISQLQFDPAPAFTGNSTFNYTATDNSSLVSNTAIYRIPVVNTPPVAVNIKTIAPFNGPAAAIIRLSGSDADGTVTSYTITTVPTAVQGVLSIPCPATPTGAVCSGGFADLTPAVLTANPGGIPLTPAQAAALRFDPATNFSGTVPFSYFVTDNNGNTSSTASYTITIENQPPVSADITVASMPNTNGATALTSLSSSDPDGTISSYTIQSLPPVVSGTLLLSGTPVTVGQVLTPAQIGSLQFDPAANFTDVVNFTYNATDNSGNASNIANYNIPITGVGNLPPVAHNISIASMSNSNGATAISSLVGSDPDGTVASYTILTLPSVSSGVLLLSGVPVTAGQVLTPAQIGSLQFDPAAGFSNSAVFTYSDIDNTGEISNTATYTIPVTGVPPVATPIVAPVMPHTNGATAIPSLIATDADGTVSNYTIEILPPASQGVLSVNGTPATAGQVITPAQISQLQFDPAPGYTGNAVFNYHATDNSGAESNSTTYTIPISGLPPASTDIIAPKVLNTAGANAIPSLSSADQDGTISSYVINSLPPASQGVLLLSGVPVTAGQVLTPAQILLLEFDPVTGFLGDAIFNYTAFDNSSNISNTAAYVIPVVTPAILPADGLLLAVNRRGNLVELTWRTLSESNTDHFETERSIDNTAFIKIGSNVTASGNSVSEKRYSLSDNISNLQIYNVLYYRVKLFDIDARSRYSNTVAIRIKTTGIAVWPTLFKEQLFISISAPSNSTLKAQLTDMAGKIIIQRNFSLTRGTNQVTFSGLEQLPKATYLLQIVNPEDNTLQNFKVVKE
jgi:hypothetical protein